MASAASTWAVRRLSSTQKASAKAARRPGGCVPSIQPFTIMMLGSLMVTHLRQWGASAGSTRATWRAKRSGDPGRNQNSSPKKAGWVKWCNVIMGSSPRLAHSSRIST